MVNKDKGKYLKKATWHILVKSFNSPYCKEFNHYLVIIHRDMSLPSPFDNKLAKLPTICKPDIT